MIFHRITHQRRTPAKDFCRLITRNMCAGGVLAQEPQPKTSPAFLRQDENLNINNITLSDTVLAFRHFEGGTTEKSAFLHPNSISETVISK